MKVSYFKPLLLTVALCFVAFSCTTKNQQSSSASSASANNHSQAGVVDEHSKPNILQIAKKSDDHTTLSAAIEAAGIEHVLVNAGPLTVFAPTNAAFEALPDGAVDDLLKAENKQKLANILTSHASPASLKIDQLTEGFQVYLATGQYVSVEKKDGETYVNGAKILGTVKASNGIIHVVDKVFLF
ncbi:MAG: fasciclin domain-containing protein [Balneolaceae bacterium]|nr:fasciclin domain-containing protein [Balneolaceae bacterium]